MRIEYIFIKFSRSMLYKNFEPKKLSFNFMKNERLLKNEK